MKRPRNTNSVVSETKSKVVKVKTEASLFARLTEKFRKPFRLVVVFNRHRAGVEQDEEDDEPVEPLLLHRLPDPEASLLLVHPKVRVLLELFLQG